MLLSLSLQNRALVFDFANKLYTKRLYTNLHATITDDRGITWSLLGVHKTWQPRPSFNDFKHVLSY